jgi:hypothetical protein
MRSGKRLEVPIERLDAAVKPGAIVAERQLYDSRHYCAWTSAFSNTSLKLCFMLLTRH